jgi:hypothetical protein
MSKDFMEGHDYISSESAPTHHGSLFLQLMKLNTVAAGKNNRSIFSLWPFLKIRETKSPTNK